MDPRRRVELRLAGLEHPQGFRHAGDTIKRTLLRFHNHDRDSRTTRTNTQCSHSYYIRSYQENQTLRRSSLLLVIWLLRGSGRENLTHLKTLCRRLPNTLSQSTVGRLGFEPRFRRLKV